MIHIVTSGDTAFVVKAAALAASFFERGSRGRFYFFGNDADAARLMRLIGPPGIAVVDFDEYATPAWRATRRTRSTIEFCQTGKPVALEHVMERYASDGDWVYWVDGDAMLFSPAEALLPPGDFSIHVTPHHYTASFRQFEADVGRINSGVAGFRKDTAGRAALRWWTERCLEWCSLMPDRENRRYTDQRYLDSLNDLFPAVFEDPHPARHAAPWNAFERPVMCAQDGTICLEGRGVVVYHFQGLKVLSSTLYDLYAGPIRVPKTLRQCAYSRYVRSLRPLIEKGWSILPNRRAGMFSTGLGYWKSQFFRALTLKNNLALSG